jgi:DNA-binding GntR family transcriptional regulator
MPPDQHGWHFRQAQRPQDLTDARIKIETLLLRESLAFGTDLWEADVVAAHHRLTKLPPLGPDGKLNTALIPIHAEFHETLLAGCPNAPSAGRGQLTSRQG